VSIDIFSFVVGALVGLVFMWIALVLTSAMDMAGREADREPPSAGSPWRDER